jgi:hypothetical protein
MCSGPSDTEGTDMTFDLPWSEGKSLDSYMPMVECAIIDYHARHMY